MFELTKPLLFTLCLSIYVAATLVVASLYSTPLTAYDAGALLLHAASLVFCAHYLIGGSEGTITLDVSRPTSLFVLFYLVWYVVLNWLSILFDEPGHRHSLEIAALTLTGLLCFRLGMYFSGYRRVPSRRAFKLSASDTERLLTMCKATMLLLVWYWAWRIATNNFFVHSEKGGLWGQLNMEHTWTASIMQNIIGPLQVPLFLVFGFILHSIDDPSRARRVRRLFWLYLAMTVALSALANQFTTIAIIMVFAVSSLNLSRPKLVTVKAYLLILVSAVFLYGVEFSVRAVSSNMGNFDEGNQLSESISALGTNSSHSDTKLKKEVFDRAFNQVNLLSQIMDRLDEGYDYLHGSAIWSLLYGLVPRAVWPNKPVVTPMQLLIRGFYGLPLKDDATGPLLEAYVNGGWLLVVPVFIGIGCFCGLITKWAAHKTSLASILLICYWWQTTGYMEQELLLTFVAAIRTIAVIAFFLWLYKICRRGYRYVVVEMPPASLEPAGTQVRPDS